MSELDDLIYRMRFERTDSDMVAEAVEYLRDYKDLLMIVNKLKSDFDFMINKYLDKNPPLSWDELKQMIGKPVYVFDWHYGGCFWHIIKDFEVADGEEWVLFTDQSRYPKSDLNEMSTIHRKEVKLR